MARYSKNFGYEQFQRWVVFTSLVATATGAASLTAYPAQADDRQVAQSYDSTAVSNSSQAEAETYESESSEGRFFGNYFGIFYGPSVKNISNYQPSPDGTPNLDRPLLIQNFGTVGYSLSENIAVSGTAYWLWQPVLGNILEMRDPFIRVAHSALLNIGNLNLYGDARVHFGVSAHARDIDMLGGLQTVQILTYQVGETPVTLAAYGSARYNQFGKKGLGNDAELYLGPNVNYRILPNLSVNVLYEMGASHHFGDDPFVFTNDGTDLQPGLLWDVTPTLQVNPYLNLYTGEKVTLDSTSFGMTLSWTLM